METSETPIFPSFENESPCSAPGFPASQVPWPGSGEARMMTVGSGRQLSMLLEEFSPLGAFSKILLESSLWTNSMEYCYVWGRLDTKFGLSAFQLTPLGQSIEDNGSSLWRTPDASIVTGGAANGEDRIKQGHALGLHDQVNTPKLWPTPIRKDAEQGSGKGHHLNPAADKKAGTRLYEAAAANLSGSGSLNPRFVCELMGFEADHTNLKHWETLLSRNKHSRSSKPSTKSKQV